PNENGYLWSKQLGLYLGIFANKLRYFTESGELVPTPQESARQERLAKEQERLAKEREQQRAEKLAQKLRELGINPDEIA
ncbi:MAG: Uma2 family endonuclease, partial [Microcystis panniformis]